MSLLETQSLFWQAITWPTGVDAFLAQASDEQRAAFERVFAETPEFSRVERVNVYAEAYFWRLYGVLKEGFPAVEWAVGPETFHNLVTDFVLQRPSVHPNLQRLGERFPSFVAEGDPGRARPWIVALAQLEWTRDELLTVPDQPVISAQALARRAPESFPGLQFVLADAVRILTFAYDGAGIWQQFMAGDSAPSEQPSPRQPFFALVWRKGLRVHHRKLGATEARALRALGAGEPFESIASHAQDPGDAASWLARWLADGLIAGVS